MDPSRQLEREIDAIEQNEAEGFISHAEARQQIQEAERDYRGQAEEAAFEAYHRELENW